MAASVVGSSAMLAKPGESLAPILGWLLFYPPGPTKALSPAAQDAEIEVLTTTHTTEGLLQNEGEISRFTQEGLAGLLVLVLVVPLLSVVVNVFF